MKRSWFAILVVLAASGLWEHDLAAERPLPDYRYFRALSIDLQGRPPTRKELAELEQPAFSFDAWIDAHLAGSTYAERLRRIYMDLLRLESSPTTYYAPPPTALRLKTIQTQTGLVDIYYRAGQRRVDPAIDGAFCFTQAETGVVVSGQAPTSAPNAITEQLLNARTVEVKPWWLYADFGSSHPSDLVNGTWANRFPGFDLVLSLFANPDKTPMTSVRVCKEEAQLTERGHITTTGRTRKPGMTPPAGRNDLPPLDSTYAQLHHGELISCMSGVGFETSWECGCGQGLERCLPVSPSGFKVAIETPLGIDQPFETLARSSSVWVVEWWSEEAKHFMDDIFENDRDMRELLTGAGTVINGPLAQFYRFFANATCCGPGAELGYGEPEPLFDPRRVPTQLIPEDTTRWTIVSDRGSHAAGILTMPVFLMKYGTRRARAHVLYTAFLCKDFVADTAVLPPSDEQDLTRRPGCAACHATLEPLASYFSRVQENDWTYLPTETFPLSSSTCVSTRIKKPHGCSAYYDPAFATATSSSLRGSYASPANAEAGPVGLAKAIVGTPEFGTCVARNVAQSLLGRPLDTEDERWSANLAHDFVANGYRMRALVRDIVTSPRYRESNDRKPDVVP